MLKSVVLLSGGLDSTVNLYKAHKETQIQLVLTFNYGQRAARKEIETAQKLTSGLKVPHRVIELSWVKDLGQSSLTDTTRTLPQGDEVQIEDYNQSVVTAKAVWVPNRNGLFMNIAAGFAEALGADIIVPGFNKEEATTFPDNTPEFLEALTASFFYSTSNKVRAYSFTCDLNKIEMVKLAKSLGIPLQTIWPCYQDLDEWCEQCESCKRFLSAMAHT